jgi:TPR repeat protein
VNFVEAKMKQRKFLLLLSFMLVALSCTPVEKETSQPTVSTEATTPIPVSDANTEPQRQGGMFADLLEETENTTRILAEKGDKEAQYQLGFMYYHGINVPQDYREAFKWYSKAADQGMAEAQYQLGFMYNNRQGVLQNYKEAVKWYTKAAEQYQKAAEQGDAAAQYKLGLMYDNGHGVAQDYKEATHWYTKAAEHENAEAQAKLGMMYLEGDGVPQDYKEAIKWLTRAAEQGMIEVQCYLGGIYYFGDIVAQDYKEAAKWLRKAAEQNVVIAQCLLGSIYYHGKGIPQDYKEAAKWYAKAAEQGDAEAQYNLGMMYYLGLGIPRDYKEAIKWHKKAAELGNAKVQCVLGIMYHNGEGVPQDYKEAVNWYQKAAEQGYAIAQFGLGMMYYLGQGVPQDYKEAFKWYKKAAEQGIPEAQYSLGVMYLDGQGVLEDYVEAYKWFLLAAMNGNKEVQVVKENLRQRMTPNQIEEAQQRAKAFLAREETITAAESPEVATEQPVIARGTGFLFARWGLVATNYHVISDGNRINVYFPNVELEFDATVELKDINSDLAILKIKDFAYDKIFSQEVPFGVRRSRGVQLGEKVFTLGFPLGELLGKSAKFSDGTISSLSGLLGSANLFQINNPIQPGNSGGPLFNQDGDLIGIVLATLDAKFFYENLDTIPQNVNFAIKSDYLISLISMLPEGPSILSRKGSLKNKTQAEQINSLVPYVVTVCVR